MRFAQVVEFPQFVKVNLSGLPTAKGYKKADKLLVSAISKIKSALFGNEMFINCPNFSFQKTNMNSVKGKRPNQPPQPPIRTSFLQPPSQHYSQRPLPSTPQKYHVSQLDLSRPVKTKEETVTVSSYKLHSLPK